MKAKLFTLFAAIMLAVFSAQADEPEFFHGNVGNYGVTGEFVTMGDVYATSGQLNGYYKYNTSSGILSIRGTWRSSGNKTIYNFKEYDTKGKVSGTWKLTYSNGRYTGTMTTKKGKTYKVTLYTN